MDFLLKLNFLKFQKTAPFFYERTVYKYYTFALFSLFKLSPNLHWQVWFERMYGNCVRTAHLQ
jgi:hypothetical protein